MSFEIVLIALVAGFLALRLYAVLGKRTGHEQEPVMRPVEERRPIAAVQPRRVADTVPDARTIDTPPAVREAQRGIEAIQSADKSFDTIRFVEGAQRAYRMTLEAFWRGDRAELAELCDEHVLAEFDAAIAAREESGEVHENRLIRIEEARIERASLDAGVARIAVRFDADVAAVIRDRDGTVVGGSMTDAMETHDVWTFARDPRSGTPDWRLVETDAA